MSEKMMWMGAGIGAGILYKAYEKDICAFMNKQKNKMMKATKNMSKNTNKNSSN